MADRHTDSDLDDGRVVAAPSRVEAARTAAVVADEWGVTLDHRTPRRGHHASVFHAHDHGGLPLAVKVVPSGAAAGIEAEVAALGEWAGRGAVRMYEYAAEHSALLLEWLNPAASLNFRRSLAAARAVGELVAAQAIAPEGEFRSTSHYADDLLTRIEDRNDRSRVAWSLRELSLILDVAHALHEPASKLLVHADLHPRNILRRPTGGWAAIDPTPYVGDPELGIAKVFWTHRWPRKPGPDPLHQMLDEACAPGGLDSRRAAQWAVLVGASAALYWRQRGGIARSAAAARSTRAFMEMARV